MSYAIETAITDTRQVIEPAVKTAWEALGYDEDTIHWPDTSFNKPGNGPWIRVAYTNQITQRENWGGGTVLNLAVSILQIQIFAPKNEGSALLYAAADKFRSTFERQSLGDGIYFRDCTGPNRIIDDKWAGVLIQLPYEYREAVTLA